MKKEIRQMGGKIGVASEDLEKHPFNTDFMDSMRLRVMTYNIYEGAVGREEAVLAVVRAAQPDVLFMQEVLDRQNAQYFADKLNMGMSSPCFADSNARTRNVIMLSRYPITVCDCFHPFPLLRTLLLATISLPNGQALNLFVVHLGLIHDWWRVYELHTILKRIKIYQNAHPATLSMIAGDFNSVAAGDRVTYKGVPLYYKIVLALQFARFPRSALAKVRQAGYIDCFRACHPHANGFTVPTTAPNVRLDYIFANSALAAGLRSCEVVQTPSDHAQKASDHYPLIADFEVPNPLPPLS